MPHPRPLRHPAGADHVLGGLGRVLRDDVPRGQPLAQGRPGRLSCGQESGVGGAHTARLRHPRSQHGGHSCDDPGLQHPRHGRHQGGGLQDPGGPGQWESRHRHLHLSHVSQDMNNVGNNFVEEWGIMRISFMNSGQNNSGFIIRFCYILPFFLEWFCGTFASYWNFVWRNKLSNLGKIMISWIYSHG